MAFDIIGERGEVWRDIVATLARSPCHAASVGAAALEKVWLPCLFLRLAGCKLMPAE